MVSLAAADPTVGKNARQITTMHSTDTFHTLIVLPSLIFLELSSMFPPIESDGMTRIEKNGIAQDEYVSWKNADRGTEMLYPWN
jgi:hypothetical protein